MANLTGSTKQVAWAEEIRAKTLSTLDEQIDLIYQNIDENVDAEKAEVTRTLAFVRQWYLSV